MKSVQRLMLLLLIFLLPLTGCFKKAPDAEPEPMTQNETPEPTDRETPDIASAMRETTVFYLSDEGFVVPVTKLVPWEQGIAAAALSYMVSTPVNLSAARQMGLSTVIPDGAQISISIADSNALVDIKNLTPLASREAEDAMISSIVNTLTQFPTVTTVTITRDGRGGALENGAELPVRQKAYALNPESADVETLSSGSPVTLYFPTNSGALTVPVTRSLQGAGIYSLVSALISGAASDKLLCCFPENTLLLGAAVENGVVTINLSEDFSKTADTEGLFSLAYKTVFLTLSEKYDFEKLRFQINGVDFAPEQVQGAQPVNPAA